MLVRKMQDFPELVTNVTCSAKKGLMAFPNSQLWWIISPQVCKLSPSYYSKQKWYVGGIYIRTKFQSGTKSTNVT